MHKINATEFKKMLESAVNNLGANVEKINDLNVFPVPDGDTGINMMMTFSAGVTEVMEMADDKDIGEIMEAFARGSLMGARGNSGVISSQIIKGMYVSLKDAKKEITANEFASIFEEAKKAAYFSVQDPVEGTILTVVKELAAEPKLMKPKFSKFEDVFEVITSSIETTVKNTPNLLPILKESNVVDSGAYGIQVIFEGMERYILGDAVSKLEQTTVIGVEKVIKADPNKNIGYCKEFIMTLKNPNAAVNSAIKHYLDGQGDSIVLVTDADIVKIHIHTINPGRVMRDLHKYGEFSKIKIENMTTQVTENPNHKTENKKTKNIEIITTANGNGLINDFNELGIEHIIEGGQSMNPSISNFVDQINSIDSKNIIILPNNSNIILAAEQAAKLSSTKNKKVIVLPTKTIPEGLAALYNFSQEQTVENNLVEMKAAIENTITVSITRSIKDTQTKKIEIKKGHYISIFGKSIEITNPNLDKIIQETLLTIEAKRKDIEIITVFTGNDTPTALINKIQKFANKNLKVEVEVKSGGQPIYDILIMAE